MKKIFLVLIMAFSIQWTFAQTYYPTVTTGKGWTVQHIYPGVPIVTVIQNIKFEGEVTADGFVYKKVWITEDSVLNGWGVDSYIREDAQKKVYLRYSLENPEMMIYDYDVQEGDTIYLRGFMFNVEQVSWITMLDGEVRQKYFLQDLTNGGQETWIQGMGCLNGVLEGGTSGHMAGTLLCFLEHDSLKYHNSSYPDCGGIISVPEIKPNDPVRVFPNPASGIFTINLDGVFTNGAVIELYDIYGRLCFTKQVKGNSLTIDPRQEILYPGTCFYRVILPTASTYTGKIIILSD